MATTRQDQSMFEASEQVLLLSEKLNDVCRIHSVVLARRVPEHGHMNDELTTRATQTPAPLICFLSDLVYLNQQEGQTSSKSPERMSLNHYRRLSHITLSQSPFSHGWLFQV